MKTDVYLDERAEERVQDWMDFYLHVALYGFVNLAFFIVNVVMQSDWWFYYPVIGWGMALGLHFVITLVSHLSWMESWRRRRISRERQKLSKTSL